MAKIFFSYRRGDTAGYAGRLYDDLVSRFGEQAVFRDMDTIAPGADFVDAIIDAIGASDVVLTVIGPGWLDAASEGRRRLDDPEDFVRLEITTALEAGKRIVPVLVGRAQLPAPAQLPEPLRPMLRHHAIEVSDERWDYDVERLVNALGPIMGTSGPPAKARRPVGANNPPPPPAPEPPTRRGPSISLLRPVAGLLVVVALLAGMARLIGGATEEGTSVTATDPGSPTDGSLLTPERREIGATVWFQGFKIVLEMAESKLDEVAGSRVDLRATLENESPEAVNFAEQLGLQSAFMASGGNNFPLGRAEPALVPGKATAKATISFAVDKAFSFDDAVLTLGNAENNQTIVPLNGNDEPATARAPRPLQIAGKVTAAHVTVEASVTEVRWDAVFEGKGNPVPVPRGKAGLAVTFTATTTARYGYNFNKDGLALRLPDGTTIFSDYCCAAIYPAEPARNIRANFIVNDPPAGSYELIVLVNDEEKRSASLPFKLD